MVAVGAVKTRSQQCLAIEPCWNLLVGLRALSHPTTDAHGPIEITVLACEGVHKEWFAGV
jgi:hypothetical protein